MMDIKGCLYRCFNEYGGLLYVGHTMDAGRRIRQHRRKPWWPEVAAITVKEYDRWQDACAAEEELLESGRCGVYNVHPRETARRAHLTMWLRKQPLAAEQVPA